MHACMDVCLCMYVCTYVRMYAYRRVYNHSSHQLFELHVACNKSHLATQISHLALRVLQCKDSPWHHGTVSILLLFEMFCFIQSRKAPLVGFLRYLKCPCKVTRCLKSSAGFLDPASSIPASLYVSCTSGLFLPYHVLTLVVKSRWIASMTKFRHTSLSLSLSLSLSIFKDRYWTWTKKQSNRMWDFFNAVFDFVRRRWAPGHRWPRCVGFGDKMENQPTEPTPPYSHVGKKFYPFQAQHAFLCISCFQNCLAGMKH